MAHFTYTAERGGEVYKGSADAVDRFEVYQIIHKEGGHLIKLVEHKGFSINNIGTWSLSFGGVKEYDKILLARNLGAMISAGLSLARALSVLERQTKSKKLAATVSSVLSDVRHGGTLHEALEKYPRVFSRLFVAMVHAGEEAGNLPESLSVISEQMERMYSLKKKIRGALIYPSVIVFAIIVIGVLMMIYVVPTLAATFKEMNVDLPASTKFVIGTSDFISGNLILSIGILVALAAALYGSARTEKGRRALDFTFLHFPMIGEMVREVNAARTARTLSSLMSSGVDVITSLDIVHDVLQNSYFKDVIQEASGAVGRGEPLSALFSRNEGLYPALVGEMMAVGEETGQTNEMMKRVAEYFEAEVDRKTKDLSTVIEPFLMLIIGSAVGFFAVSMISPIYSLSSGI